MLYTEVNFIEIHYIIAKCVAVISRLFMIFSNHFDAESSKKREPDLEFTNQLSDLDPKIPLFDPKLLPEWYKLGSKQKGWRLFLRMESENVHVYW